MNLKEYYKARLMEDLGSPELMGNIRAKEAATNQDMSDLLDKIARSPYLHITDPNNPNRPIRVPGTNLHPDLIAALDTANKSGGKGLTKKQIEMVKDYIRQHGHFEGAINDTEAYPETFATNQGPLGKIFK